MRSTFTTAALLTTLLAFCLGAPLCSANQVTFTVHMGVQRSLGNFNPDNGDTVLVAGTFSNPNWVTTFTLSNHMLNTNLYVGTFTNDIPAGNFEFHKFIINPGGNSPANQLIWESIADRSALIATNATQTLPFVLFNNLGANTIVVTQVTFRVNMEAQITNGTFNPATDTVSVSSDLLNGWSMTASPLTNSPLQPHLWRGTFTISNIIAGIVKYKFVQHPQGGGDIAETNFTGGATNRQYLTVNNPLVLPLTDFNNQQVPIDFIAGVDMSHLVFFEDRGVEYRVNGVVQDALELLEERGINCVRLRLFTSTAAQAQADAYNYTNNLSYNLPLAVRVKNAGLKFLLDFHYSDSWADPGKQIKPAAWTNLNFTALKAEVRSYTSNTIAAFNAAGAMPDYVQIGNEIITGMLWNDGRVGGGFDTPTQWSQLAQLLASAFQGIKDVAGNQMPKVMIHVDRGADWGGTQWYFDHIEAEQVPFDLIGESYYGWWHGSPDSLRYCLNNAANRYGRPIVLVETAFPWDDSTNVFGIPATPAGQVQFVTLLAQIVKGVPGRKGVGIFWWGTEYQEVIGEQLAGFDRRSFFGANGDVLPVADAFGLLTAPIALNTSLTGSNLKLSWPLSGAAMDLIHAPDLYPTTVWSPVTNSISNTNGIFSVTVPPTQPASFYRLTEGSNQ